VPIKLYTHPTVHSSNCTLIKLYTHQTVHSSNCTLIKLYTHQTVHSTSLACGFTCSAFSFASVPDAIGRPSQSGKRRAKSVKVSRDVRPPIHGCNTRYLQHIYPTLSFASKSTVSLSSDFIAWGVAASAGATAHNLSAAGIVGSCRSRRRLPLSASVQPRIPEKHAPKAHARSAAASPRGVRARRWHRRSLLGSLGPSCSRQERAANDQANPSLGDESNSNPDSSHLPRPTPQCLGLHLCLGSGPSEARLIRPLATCRQLINALTPACAGT
jgi:hypothetical protein